jgi:hypothetical protein
LPEKSNKAAGVYKPHVTYLHFMAPKYSTEEEGKNDEDEDGKVGQTAEYVSWCFDLLECFNIFSGFRDIILWSDNCFKHFKTHSIHAYMARLKWRLMEKQNLRELQWKFLAPFRAHNRCDSAAAMLKIRVNTFIRSSCLMTSLAHIAFACADLKNTYIIKVDTVGFNDLLKVRRTWLLLTKVT